MEDSEADSAGFPASRDSRTSSGGAAARAEALATSLKSSRSFSGEEGLREVGDSDQDLDRSRVRILLFSARLTSWMR